MQRKEWNINYMEGTERDRERWERERGERISEKGGKQRAIGRLLGGMKSANRFCLYCKSHHNTMY